MSKPQPTNNKIQNTLFKFFSSPYAVIDKEHKILESGNNIEKCLWLDANILKEKNELCIKSSYVKNIFKKSIFEVSKTLEVYESEIFEFTENTQVAYYFKVYPHENNKVFLVTFEEVQIENIIKKRVSHFLKIDSLGETVSQSLIDNFERSKYVIRASHSGVYDFNFKTGEVWRSSTFYEIFGYNKREIKDDRMWWDNNIHPTDIDRVNLDLQEAAGQHKNIWQSSYRFKQADGTYAYVTDQCYILYDKMGNISRIIGGINNVTDKKMAERKARQSERKLQKSERLLKTINENVTEGIYRSNKSSFVYVNKAFAELFGYESPKEMIRMHPDRIYAMQGQRKKLITESNTESGTTKEEILYKRKDGSTFWGIVSSIKWQDENGNEFYDGVIVDISERKEIENKIILQNEQLEKTNAELDRFVYSTSHDLKAPLTSLLGLINIIRIERTNADISMHLDMMQDSVYQLDEFIKEILDFSRNARQKITYEEIDLCKIVTDCYNNLEYMPNSDVISKKLKESNNKIFYSDSMRIKVIVNNLVSNAIRYYDSRKKDPTITTEINVKEDKVEMIISDNGIGIEQEYQDKVFEMFYKANDKIEGSGLGLYIVKETTQRLGGEIAIKSEVNKGTTFTVIFPNKKVV